MKSSIYLAFIISLIILGPSSCFTLFPVDCSLYRTDDDILHSFDFDVPIDIHPPDSITTYGEKSDTESIGSLTITDQKRVPKAVVCLKKLKHLTIRNTPFDALEHLGTSLTELRIYDTPVGDLPVHIGRWRHLQTLILSNTSLTKLPKTIGDLKALQILDLSDNQLRSLPVSIGKLTSIRQITLNNNPALQSIEPLNGLATLEVLQAQNCSIHQLPSDLPQLILFSLAWNHLVRLEGIQTLGAKTAGEKVFDFTHNGLKSIPAQIQYVHHLRSLDLDHNRLITLPNNLLEIPSLRYLSVRDNPLHKCHVKDLIRRFTRLRPKVELHLPPAPCEW